MAGKKKSRPVLSGLVVLALVATSGYLTWELRKQEAPDVTEVRNVGVLDGSEGSASDEGKDKGKGSRLENPAHSVLRGSDGQIKAVSACPRVDALRRLLGSSPTQPRRAGTRLRDGRVRALCGAFSPWRRRSTS